MSPSIPKKVRKLIKGRVAIPKRDKLGNFYIQMKIEVGESIPHKTVVGIDPGKLYSGMAVQTPEATLWMGHLILPFFKVKDGMKNRKEARHFRRYRKTPQRKDRFLHRTKCKIPPSIKSNRDLEYRVLLELLKIYPINKIIYEVIMTMPSKHFSPIMVGQQWQIKRLFKILPMDIREGWQTANLREHLNLIKEKEDKGKMIPATHAVDGIALAANEFIKYEFFENSISHGHIWQGECKITNAPFSIISRPWLFRRKLHVVNYAKGGIRKRHGTTTTPYIFRKGDYAEGSKSGIIYRGYVSGYTQGKHLISLSDVNWWRIGKFVISKIRLLRRSTHLLIKHYDNSNENLIKDRLIRIS